MRVVLGVCVLLCAPAWAGVEEVVSVHLTPGYEGFAQAANRLAEAAQADCAAAALDAPYQATWDAWGQVADIRLGPAEPAALSIAFWPDERGAGPRALDRLITAGDPAGLDPAAFAEMSVAARGLFALDHLLHAGRAALGDGGFGCALVRTVAADLAAQAEALAAAWTDEARALTTAGAPDNARYLSEDEAFRAIYTQVLAGLAWTADTRLGRPLGAFDRPRPTRAEAWRSGRPLANALGSAEAAARVAGLLADAPPPGVQAALEDVRRAAAAVADPSFQDILDPQARLRVEALQQRVRALRAAIEAEVGAPRGVAAGFNSQDGD